MSESPKKDNSEKACIHITQAQKLVCQNALGITPKKGTMPALIRALPKWAAENKKIALSIVPFVNAEMPSTMSAGQKVAKAIDRTENPQKVILDMLKALPKELREQAEKELSNMSGSETSEVTEE